MSNDSHEVMIPMRPISSKFSKQATPPYLRHLPFSPYLSALFVTSVTYGRNSSLGKELCDGEKPKDNKSPALNCYKDDQNALMLSELQSACHHNFNCTYSILTVPLDPVCDGLRRETRIEYICGS